jgi:hypothetical protein
MPQLRTALSAPPGEAWPSLGRRSLARPADLRVVQGASSSIVELGDELDARLRGEPLAHEQLRLLRETTYRITRTANDAVLAYQRASRSLTAALARPDADAQAVAAVRAQLDAARADVLRALALASRRYPSANQSSEPIDEAGSGAQEHSGDARVAEPGAVLPDQPG